MPEEVKRILDGIVNLWNTGDPEIAKQLYSDHAERHDPLNPMPRPGPGEIARYVADVRTGYPDFQIKITDSIAQGNRLITQWTCTGTHKGLFQGIPATGKQTRINGVSLSRLEKGKIVEEHVFFDRLALIEQMGVAPDQLMNKAKQTAK